MAKAKAARLTNRPALIEALRSLAARDPAVAPMSFGPQKGAEGFAVSCPKGEYAGALKVLLEEAPGLLALLDSDAE